MTNKKNLHLSQFLARVRRWKDASRSLSLHARDWLRLHEALDELLANPAVRGKPRRTLSGFRDTLLEKINGLREITETLETDLESRAKYLQQQKRTDTRNQFRNEPTNRATVHIAHVKTADGISEAKKKLREDLLCGCPDCRPEIATRPFRYDQDRH